MNGWQDDFVDSKVEKYSNKFTFMFKHTETLGDDCPNREY